MDGVASTGIEAIDTFLRGGLPTGYTTLLLAPPGAGAEIFAKQFAAGGAGAGRVVYLTTDESTAEVKRVAKEAGWDFSNVQVVDLQTDFSDAMMDAQQRVRDTARPPEASRRAFDPRDLVEGTSSLDLLKRSPPPSGHAPSSPRTGGGLPKKDYLEHLIDPYTRLRSPDRMVVHSLDFFLNLYPAEDVLAALTALKAANTRTSGLLLLVLSKGAHGATVERRLELLADCLIELEMTRKGTAFERFFLVKKVKNRSHGIGVSTYDITPTGFHLQTLERIL